MGDYSCELSDIASSLNQINQTLGKILKEMQRANNANPIILQKEKERLQPQTRP